MLILTTLLILETIVVLFLVYRSTKTKDTYIYAGSIVISEIENKKAMMLELQIDPGEFEKREKVVFTVVNTPGVEESRT